ncbi:MAG: helicase [Synechococcus sp.]
MLEAQAHQQLKSLLRQDDGAWPHQLTLSRLVGRSLRRRDQTLIHLSPDSRDRWWLGLLVPLCLKASHCVLVLNQRQRERLLQIELPKLRNQGVPLPCWDGPSPPPGDQLWLLGTSGLIRAHHEGWLEGRQLLIPDVDQLSRRLRRSLTIRIDTHHWEILRRAHPQADRLLLDLHERLSRRLFRDVTHRNGRLRMEGADLQALKDLLQLLQPSPDPWGQLLQTDADGWVSWAVLDHSLLQWSWRLAPLEPLQHLRGLLRDQPTLLLSCIGKTSHLDQELHDAGFEADVAATLGDSAFQEPVPIYAPRHQPLPNTEIYAEHLLDHCRRLVLGRRGLTVILLDDSPLRLGLTSALAAEFGSRVKEEATAPEPNGVISARWSWWLKHQHQLPQPEQLIVGLLPIASLTSPLTAARVERMKRNGDDWFRNLLLPEALSLLPAAVAPLRQSGGRLAILDGRLRGRRWGDQVLTALEPWVPLHRLLPD